MSRTQANNLKNSRERGMAQAMDALKLLTHPLRLSILCHLMEDGELSAGDIVDRESHRASQSQISQYLNKMRIQGLISARRDGHYIYYTLADKRIRTMIQTLHKLYCPA